MPQRDFAAALHLGRSPAYVSNAESGKRPPTRKGIHDWAAAAGVRQVDLDDVYLLLQGLVPTRGINGSSDPAERDCVHYRSRHNPLPPINEVGWDTAEASLTERLATVCQRLLHDARGKPYGKMTWLEEGMPSFYIHDEPDDFDRVDSVVLPPPVLHIVLTPEMLAPAPPTHVTRASLDRSLEARIRALSKIEQAHVHGYIDRLLEERGR